MDKANVLHQPCRGDTGAGIQQRKDHFDRAQFYTHKTLKDGSKVNADMIIYNIAFLFG